MSNRSRQAGSSRQGRRASQSRQVGARPATGLIAAGILTALVLAYLLLLFVAPTVLPSFMRWGIGTSSTVSAEGRIAFVRSNPEAGKNNLFVVNPDSTNQQQLTSDIHIDQAIWSPDGKYLAAQGTLEGSATGIIRVEVGPDNKPVQILNLTANIQADSVLPAWSPDGSRIAFQSKRDGGDYQVFVMNADGSNQRRVSDGNGSAKHASWSPDGKNIAYVAGGTGSASSDVYMVPAVGGTPAAITQIGAVLTYPIWTHDGKAIVFTVGAGDRDQAIDVVPVEGGTARTIVEQGAIKSVQISPTEDKLVYHRVLTELQQGGSDIFTVPVAGGTPTLVTPLSSNDYNASWSPDGNKLTWASSRLTAQGNDYKIVVANADGSEVVVVSSGPGSDYAPQWAPAVK